MSSSSKFFRILTGIAFILIALTILVNPIDYLVNLSWILSLGLFISAISSLINYLTLPRELKHPIYLLDALVNVFVALYLFTRGFAFLPFVIPSVLGIWLIFQAVSLFIKGRRLSYVLPIIGSNVTWISVIALILGIILVVNPVGAGTVVMYTIALAFLSLGISALGAGFSK